MKAKNIMQILIILLLICGCKDGFLKKENGYTFSDSIKEIHAGKDGLVMEFFEDAPPKEVLENSPFPIAIRLYNKGAYNIEGGRLSIGLEKDYMSIDKDSLKSINEDVKFVDVSDEIEHITFDLKGKTIEQITGGHDLIRFTVSTKDLSKTDPQSESHTSLVSVTSCYGYQTTTTETVCIDTDPYNFKKREKSCEVQPIALNSQGAPIAVTKIETEMIPDEKNPNKIKPRFVITVKNLGNGEAIKYDKVEAACKSEPLDYKEWNSINIKAYLSTIEDKNKLDCDIIKGSKIDDGTLSLRQKEDSIRCSYEEGFDEARGTFSAPLSIILDYGYTNTISKEVEIKKILTH